MTKKVNSFNLFNDIINISKKENRKKMNGNNYLSSAKVKNMFKGLQYDFKLHNIDVNGQKRGCSGFIVNMVTDKICYITTEQCFNSSGLWNDKNKAVMLRSAKSLTDYSGGNNQWSSIENIVLLAERITKKENL